MKVPKVTVGIPVYNGAEYIGEAIESVLAQTFKDFQLIVCDNRSTDETEKIVRSFGDSRVRFHRNETNLGPAGNANRCLELAEGEYVCIFHHDDVMLPENLERKVEVLDRYPDVGFVHSNLIVIDSQGTTVEENIWCEKSRTDYVESGPTVFEQFLDFLPFGASVFIGAVVARRSCYEKVGRFDPSLRHCNDSEMWLRMMLFFRVACLGARLVKYRVHSFSASSAFGGHTSAPYLKEHYLAASMVLRSYAPHILRLPEMRRRLRRAFGARALEVATQCITESDWSNGKALCKEAMLMDRSVILRLNFWIVAAALALGSHGVVERYRSAKKKLLA